MYDISAHLKDNFDDEFLDNLEIAFMMWGRSQKFLVIVNY